VSGAAQAPLLNLERYSKAFVRETVRNVESRLDGESRVRDFFIANGLRVERFTKWEVRQGRTPDFKVSL